MSILIALRLTEDNGLFAADRAYSYQGRAIKYEDKIFPIGEHLVGFTGDLSIRDPILKKLRLEAKDDDLPNLVTRVVKAYRDERDKQFEVHLTNEGYRPIDWHNRGKNIHLDPQVLATIRDLERTEPNKAREMVSGLIREIPTPIVGKLEDVYKNPRYLDATFIVAGQNRNGLFEIYRIDFPGSAIDMGYFDVIGPQSSREVVHNVSRRVMGCTSDVESLKGGEISKGEGARIALSVIREGWQERGIGGSTQITMVNDGNIISYTPGESIYMHNLLELERKGKEGRKLDPSHVSEAIKKVMERQGKFEDIVDSTIKLCFGSQSKASRLNLRKHLTEDIIISDPFAYS